MSTHTIIRTIEQCFAAELRLDEAIARGETVDEAALVAKQAWAELRQELNLQGDDQQCDIVVTKAREYLAEVESFDAGVHQERKESLGGLRQKRAALAQALKQLNVRDGSPISHSEIDWRPNSRMLIAVNQNEPSKWALQYGGELATSLRAKVMLLHVITPLTAYGAASTYEVIRGEQHLLRDAEILLNEMKSLLPATLSIECKVLQGNAAREIIEVSRTWVASMIVVGNRARGRLGELFLGNTAESIARIAPCPVIMVNRDPRLAEDMQHLIFSQSQKRKEVEELLHVGPSA